MTAGMPVPMTLTRTGVSDAVAAAERFLREGRATRESEVCVRLALEDALLFFRGRLGESAEFGLTFRRRFGRLLVRVSVAGRAVNPLTAGEGDADVLARLIRLEDFSPRWAWRDGVNEVEFVAARRRALSPTWRVVLAFFAGLAAGGSVAALSCRAEAAVAFADRVSALVLDMFRGVAGPFIFVSLVCSICAIGNLSLLKRIGSALFVRAFSVLLCFSAAGVAVARLFCASGEGGGDIGEGRLCGLLSGLVPVNLVAPFVEGNIPQVVVLAIVIGCILLSLGDRGRPLVELVDRVRAVMNALLRLVLTVCVPLLVFCCLFSLLAGGRLSVLLGSWKIVALAAGVSAAGAVAILLGGAVRFRESPVRTLRASLPPLLTALTTGSSLAALPGEMEVLKGRFGVRPEFVDFAAPFIQPLSLFTYCAELAVMMVCMGEFQALSITPEWLVAVAAVVPLAAISTPPVPGGSGFVLGMLCAQFGIGADCVGLLVTLDIVLDYAITWMNTIIRLGVVRSAARALAFGII